MQRITTTNTTKKSLTTTDKKREQTGPKITRRNEGIFFRNIRFTQDKPKPKHSPLQDLFDEEDEREEERLKAQGVIVGTSYDY